MFLIWLSKEKKSERGLNNTMSNVKNYLMFSGGVNSKNGTLHVIALQCLFKK